MYRDSVAKLFLIRIDHSLVVILYINCVADEVAKGVIRNLFEKKKKTVISL
jgi:hypothetical protein